MRAILLARAVAISGRSAASDFETECGGRRLILDAVEYHEAALPDGVGWESAAALMAALIVWAKEQGNLRLLEGRRCGRAR